MHARAWVAHGARKFRWKRSYSITLRQLPPHARTTHWYISYYFPMIYIYTVYIYILSLLLLLLLLLFIIIIIVVIIIILYYIILYYIILYYNHIILYHIILYHIILYHIILYMCLTCVYIYIPSYSHHILTQASSDFTASSRKSRWSRSSWMPRSTCLRKKLSRRRTGCFCGFNMIYRTR